MFKIICGNCGAEGKIINREEYNAIRGKAPKSCDEFNVIGDISLYVVGYDGELAIDCDKCGETVSER